MYGVWQCFAIKNDSSNVCLRSNVEQHQICVKIKDCLLDTSKMNLTITIIVVAYKLEPIFNKTYPTGLNVIVGCLKTKYIC